MCYKLTSLYGISHGHAAALCVNKLWPYMIIHTNDCIDIRGSDYLDDMFIKLAEIMNCNAATESTKKFSTLLQKLNMNVPLIKSKDDFEILKKSVNSVRLKNNPIKLNEKIIDNLYHQIMENN